jgi:trimeric autotransporter adhesin
VPPGRSRSAFLNKTRRETADVSATVEINKPGSSVVVLGRKVKADDYRAIAKLTSGRRVSVSLASRQAGETVPLSNTVRLMGSYRAGEEIKIRMQVFGVNPTVIRTKVWRSSEVEPQAWSVTAQDGFDRLQRSGVVGVGVSRPSSALDPLRLSVLDFVTRPVIG